MSERWKYIEGFEGLYQISSEGNVKSFYGKSEHLLKKTKSTTGYYRVKLCKVINGKRICKDYKVHRLVALAFINQVYGKPYINHRDGNKLNNKVKNLEWCSQQQNIIHAYNNGLTPCFKISEETLKNLYNGDRKSVNEIARELNTTADIVRYNMKKYKIKARTISEAKDKYHIDLNILADEINSGKSNSEIAKKYSCTAGLIAVRKHQLKKAGKVL